MKPYPQYKDSGVEWLGELPDHWEILPIKHLAIFINGDAFKPSEWTTCGTPIIRIQNLNGGEDFNYFNGDIEERYLVTEGDLLFGWSGNRGTSFGPFLWQKHGIYALNQHIFRVIPKGSDKRLLYWALKAATTHIEEQAHGIIGMVHITKGDLGAINVPAPPIPEQTTIADFLDRKTAEIDSIIAKKERLIELYEEEKAAVINHAVTKGLDPAAKMKDSGIEWLGEIPEHWEIIPLRRTIWSIDQGWSPIADSSPAIENQNGVLKLSCIREGKFISSENKALLDELYFDIKTLSPTNGDILISRANTPERVGDTCFIDKNYPFLIIPDLIYRLKVNRESLHPKYLVSFLLSRSGRTQIQLDARGTSGSMVKVGQNHLRNWLIPLPLLDEQAAIVQYVETKCSHIDAIISKFKRQIELLKEYRTALISEAVTGKIDVRENMHN